MRALLKKWQSLSRADQWLVAKLCLQLPLARVRIALLGTQHSLAWAQQLRSTPAAVPSRDACAALVERNCRLVNIAARRGLISASCLPRSLVLCRLLRAAGIDARVQIGVRKLGSALDAHAWVEVEGIPTEDGTTIYRSFGEDLSKGRTASRP